MALIRELDSNFHVCIAYGIVVRGAFVVTDCWLVVVLVACDKLKLAIIYL